VQATDRPRTDNSQERCRTGPPQSLALLPLGRLLFVAELATGSFAVEPPIDLGAGAIHPAIPRANFPTQALQVSGSSGAGIATRVCRFQFPPDSANCREPACSGAQIGSRFLGRVPCRIDPSMACDDGCSSCPSPHGWPWLRSIQGSCGRRPVRTRTLNDRAWGT
jgi:hypothetical protein